MNRQEPMNSYIPKATQKKLYEWYEPDLMTYIDGLKYKNFTKDLDSHFSRAKIVNFGLIYHQWCRNKFNNPRHFYKTIRDKDFKNYEDGVRNRAMPSAIKFERDDVCCEHHLLVTYI